MKIECTIDGKRLSFSLNSNKPLSLVLQENCDYTSVNAHCRGKNCGLCLVLVDNMPVLSCMVPAFEIQGKTITTIESFRKIKSLSKKIKDIEKAYEDLGIKPCEDCYTSRTILFDYLTDIIIAKNNEQPSFDSNAEPFNVESLVKEMSIIKCTCMDLHDVKLILNKIRVIREKRIGRRS